MPFKEHGLLIFLDKKLLVGFNKLMGDKELGRSFTALLCLTEGLYRHGYISKQVYEAHKKRYSTPLTKDPQQVTLEEHREALERKQLNDTLGMAVSQFNMHKDKDGWVEHFVKKARVCGDLPNARRFLAMVEEHRSG